MVTLVFAAPPVVTTVDPSGLFLPCSTDDWTVEGDETAWIPPTVTLYDDAMKGLWSGQPLLCSTFGVRILATSIFLEIWQAQRGHGAWLGLDWKERHYVVLETLQNHINTAWNVLPLVLILQQISSDDADPLVWNSTFILQGCYARLASDTTFVEEALCRNGTAVSQGLKLTYTHFNKSYVDLRSIRAALNAFIDICRRGLKFISNTGCWSRGIEHALCGFHSAAHLVNWVRHCEEHKFTTPEEAVLLGELQKALEEGDVRIYPESLAATLARSSIQLMDQVWIWGITPLMGEAFRFYAEEILGSGAAIRDVEPILLEDEQSSEYGG
jgi:hypothetical protein